MSISQETVARMAELSKLELDEATRDRFARQFSDILRYMDELNAVDTQGVEALYRPVQHSAAPRPDLARASLDRETLLACAPEQDGQHFVVPRIVG
ncbi:MAG: Asp-tRNA(Asn)/Glu-tRNA(Gln) amidotransferase subunit GatC [Deltaproteobacteria bacterium]|jgi:aspartyl-tRNA(Asn)/glutamyl-tRNA(Gln) amidotransferase subunit C|nr:Asp-tRNA(Asn)/Glu-tRNA(Gln) amidotransferase subunit GatC [Deltaproteobacteria bacterium]